MATVIDTLVIELGLDPSKFAEGEKQAMASHKKVVDQLLAGGNEIEAQGKKTVEFFSILKREALGILGVFLAGRGIKEFVGYITSLDAGTSRLSKTLNMTTRETSAWQGAMEQTGGKAESANGALSGLTGEMNKFMLTGQASFLPVLNRLGIGLFDANKNLKTAGQLFLELSDAVKTMDPARAAAFLSMIPGMNQDTINLLVQGRAAVERYLESARKAGGTTEESGQAARDYQRDLANLERSATSLTRVLTSGFIPSLNGIFVSLTKILQLPAKDVIGQFFKIAPNSALDVLIKWLRSGKDATLSELWSGLKGSSVANREEVSARGRLAEGLAVPRSPSTGSPASTEQEAYIRKAAAARGIDPDVAVAVARSEGLNNYVGDKGTSFGPFQLHYKNNIPGLSNSGLGDKFTKQTGKHASDPSTWKEQVDFALDEAKKGGWGAWHGWKGLPFQGIGVQPGAPAAAGVTNNQRGGDVSSSSSNTSVHVGSVNITAPNAKTNKDVAAEISEALRRTNFAASANYGLTG